MTNSRLVLLGISLLVSGLFLWLTLRDVPLASILTSLRTADLGWIAVSLIFTGLGLWTRAIRWRGLLGFRLPLVTTFHIINITFLLNQLPLRAGEITRSLLAMRYGIPLLSAATSIVVERVLDTLLVVILLVIALSQLPSILPEVAQIALLFGAASIIAFMGLLGLARYPSLAYRILACIEAKLPWLARLGLRGWLENIIGGLQPLTQWRSASHAVAWTLISWALSFATLYALERALAVDEADLLLSTLMGVSLSAFSIAIPVSLASIGPFEGAIRLAGSSVGMSTVLATALGFLLHGIIIFSYALWGSLGLITLGVSLDDVLNKKT